MNKNDCEILGFILSEAHEYENLDALIDRLIKLDPRIEQEFLSFSENRLRREKIEKLRDQKLLEKFGEGYFLKKLCTVDEYKKAYAEAKIALESEEL